MCLCLSLAGTTVFNVCTAASFIFYVDQENLCVRVLYPYVFENAVLETWASGVQVRFSTSTCPLGLVCKMVSFATFHHFHHWYQTGCFSLARPLQLLQPSLGSFDKSYECCEPSMTCDSLTWFGKQFLVLDKRSRTGSVNGEQSKLLRGIHCNQDNWCDRLSFAPLTVVLFLFQTASYAWRLSVSSTEWTQPTKLNATMPQFSWSYPEE